MISSQEHSFHGKCDDIAKSNTNDIDFMKKKGFLLNLLLLSLFSGWIYAANPTVDITATDPLQVNLGQVQVDATAVDLDGDALDFQWSFQSLPAGVTNVSIVKSQLSPTQSRATFNINQEGTYVLQVIVDDLDGNPVSRGSDVLTINAVFSQLFFVSNNGDDNTDVADVSESNPLKTIQKALDYAGPGDNVILLPDSVQAPTPTTFNTNTLTLASNGAADNPITIRSQNSGLIRIRPIGTNQALNFTNKQHIHVQDLIFDGFSDSAIRLTSSSDIRIESCKFVNNGIGVSIRQSQKTSVVLNTFEKNRDGVSVFDARNNAVQFNIFDRNTEHGYVQTFAPGDPSLNNTIQFNTFYGNGTVFDENNKHGAVNMGNNSGSIVEFNIFVANARDYYHKPGLQQIRVNQNISWQNVGIQADLSLLPIVQLTVWPVSDPLLRDPEAGDFRLISGSPAINGAGDNRNFGSYQGTPAVRPTTRDIFVDFDEGSVNFIQNGQSANPYDSINKAIVAANPGDTIYVRGSTQKSYTLDLGNRNKFVPGWGGLKLVGVPVVRNNQTVYPKITCFADGQRALQLINSRFLHLDNFVITGFKNGVPDLCSEGVFIQDSNNVILERMMVHGVSGSGVMVDSVRAMTLRSSIIYDSTIALDLKNTLRRNQHNLYDKLTVHDNLNGISVAQTYHTSIQNSIIYKNFNSPCMTFSAVNPPTEMEIRYTLCNQAGAPASFFTSANSGNIVGSGTDSNPLFLSEEKSVQNTNPWSAFRLKASGTSISPALNAGDPAYNPALVLNEFPQPLTLNLPTSVSKSVIGTIDMGAFEQSRTDVDGDNLNNLIDNQSGLDPNDPLDAQADFDGDELKNIDELSLHRTEITSADTDRDGFSDGVEVNIGSDPLTPNADEIRQLVPIPVIAPHNTNLPPSQFSLSGLEQNGRSVTNRWVLVSGPSNVTENEIFISDSLNQLLVRAKAPGNYVIGLDQELIPDTQGGPTLRSLAEDRAITTITIQDVAPTPVIPPDITTTYAPGRVVYFYGSPSVSNNPSFDGNDAQIISYQWILESPRNPPNNLINFSSPTPTMVLPDRTAVYQFRLKVTSSGTSGVQSATSDPFTVRVQGSQVSLPIAEAGPDLYLRANAIQTLIGTGSGDLDNGVLSYFWRQTQGPAVNYLEPAVCELTVFQPSAQAIQTTSCTTGVNPRYIADEAGVVEFELVVQKTVNNEKFTSQGDRVIHILDEPANSVPLAVVSGPQTETIFQNVQIIGSQSSDRAAAVASGQNSGSNLQYEWSIAEGPPAYLEVTNQSVLNFTPIYRGNYVVQLRVRDQQGLWSAPSRTTVRVEEGNFFLPVANAGSNQTGLIRRTIVLDGTNSLGGSENIENYFWTQTKGPELVKIQNPNSPTIAFIPSKSGLYEFSLRVGTLNSLSEADTVEVAINSDEQFVPVAIPGESRTVAVSAVVELDGRSSFDQDGDPLTYLWQQTFGTPVLLSSANQAVVTFFAASSGVYEFSLTVNDGKANSLPSNVLVAVNPRFESNPNNSLSTQVAGFNRTTILGPDAKGSCFILTASFGKRSAIVKTMLWFRDNVLLKVPGGRTLMSLYYWYSPPFALLIEKSTLAKLTSQFVIVLCLLFSAAFLLLSLLGIARAVISKFYGSI